MGQIKNTNLDACYNLLLMMKTLLTLKRPVLKPCQKRV